MAELFQFGRNQIFYRAAERSVIEAARLQAFNKALSSSQVSYYQIIRIFSIFDSKSSPQRYLRGFFVRKWYHRLRSSAFACVAGIQTRKCHNLTQNCNPNIREVFLNLKICNPSPGSRFNREICGRGLLGGLSSGLCSLQRALGAFPLRGNFLLIFICNFHVLSYLLLIYICKLHWNPVLWATLNMIISR